MADTLNFGEAVQRAGVSRHRLNEAIKSGRLPAQRGGGPGKRTTIRLEDLQAWCLSEGLALPVETSERLERSTGPELATLMERLERLDELFAGMQRLEQLMAQVLERLEHSTAPAVSSATQEKPSRPRPDHPQKAGVLQRLRTLQAEGLSLQAMANRLNSERIPTLSGKGSWKKGTISNLLKE